MKTILPDPIPRNAPPVVLAQPTAVVKKKKKFSLGSAQIHVVECVDDNNNAGVQENCWFKFLSVICAWRVRFFFLLSVPSEVMRNISLSVYYNVFFFFRCQKKCSSGFKLHGFKILKRGMKKSDQNIQFIRFEKKNTLWKK